MPHRFVKMRQPNKMLPKSCYCGTGSDTKMEGILQCWCKMAKRLAGCLWDL